MIRFCTSIERPAWTQYVIREILTRIGGRAGQETTKQITVRIKELKTGAQRGISIIGNAQSSTGPIKPNLTWPRFEYVFRPYDPGGPFHAKLFYNVGQIDIN